MKIRLSLLAALITLTTLPTYAVNAFVTGKIEKTMISDRFYGGCMILGTAELADAGLDCPSRWITFSCTGEFNEKDVAARKFDAAQLALATNKTFSALVTDTKKHNGYCFAHRFDVVQ